MSDKLDFHTIGLGPNSVTAQRYLEEKIYPDLTTSLNMLLDHVQKSGELAKYWKLIEDKSEEARKEARRVDKERKKLEMGSDYESSESDGDYEEQFIENNDESDNEATVKAPIVDAQYIQTKFCPLRYMSEILKGLAEKKH